MSNTKKLPHKIRPFDNDILIFINKRNNVPESVSICLDQGIDNDPIELFEINASGSVSLHRDVDDGAIFDVESFLD